MPIKHEACIADSLLEDGLGHLIVLRKKTPEKVEAGIFLIDAYCLGVRDAIFYEGTEAEVRERIETQPHTLSEKPADDARTFVEASIAYAKKFGFAPHKDYKKAARVFGGLKASGDLKGFTFGKDGKPYYIQSRYHSEDDARRIVAKLTRICGEDGFNVLLKLDGPAGFDEETQGEIEERIVLYEGWLDGLTPEREKLLADGPSQEAQRCFLEFADQERFAGDPLFRNPVWEHPAEGGTLDTLILAAQKVVETTPVEIDEDPADLRDLVLRILLVFANFYGEGEDFVEEQFAAMVREKVVDESMIPFLRELYFSESIAGLMEAIVHPEPGLDVRPMSLEKIDETSGHCLLICLEEYDPE